MPPTDQKVADLVCVALERDLKRVVGTAVWSDQVTGQRADQLAEDVGLLVEVSIEVHATLLTKDAREALERFVTVSGEVASSHRFS